MLTPVPVVVDADVLVRNVDYTIRRGYPGALLGQASRGYALNTGVVLFATALVGEEAERHLPEVAERRHVPLAEVRDVWEASFLPRIRFVDVCPEDVEDPRVDEVRQLDPPDAGTAALVSLVAPAILATDNRKHFHPMGLPSTKTDVVARDLFALGHYTDQANTALLGPRLAGITIVEGSKKLVEKLGRADAATVGLLLVGALGLLLGSERARPARQSFAASIQKATPMLVEATQRLRVAGERVTGFAVEPSEAPTALAIIARSLAVGRPVMTTRDVALELRGRFAFDQPGRFETKVRSWLVDEPCFFELRRGHWTLGYYRAGA